MKFRNKLESVTLILEVKSYNGALGRCYLGRLLALLANIWLG
jgi:hypothetical protein